MIEPFSWRDGERLIAFGRGLAERAVDLLGGPGYTLLTTERAAAAAPRIAEAAATVHHVPTGQVHEVAGELLEALADERQDAPQGLAAAAGNRLVALGAGRATDAGNRLVALGGGRVIDVAKALAAAANARAGSSGGGAPDRQTPAVATTRALAVPTTLSGAEMTRGHRHARGVDPSTPRVRPAVVVTDPRLAASQPERPLTASALNALGHAVEAPCTTRANPVATLVAHEAIRHLVGGLARPAEPHRDRLALGALLAGYAIGATGLGLHHVLAQTLVRVGGAAHGPANAVMLPHTIGALAWRRPQAHEGLAAAFGEDPADAATRLAERAGAARLADIGVDASALPRCAEAAAARDDLELTPPRAEAREILAIYEQAL